MLKLFTKSKPMEGSSLGITVPGDWDHVHHVYYKELVRVQNYYRDRRRAVNNSHYLSRLIRTATPRMDLDIVSFYRHLATNARNVSRQFDITSNVERGNLHEDIIISNNSYESYLYVEKDIDIFDFEDWKTRQPIRVIKTDQTDINFENYYDSIDTEDVRYTIFEIDIIELCIQYYFYYNEQTSFDNDPDINVFVATCVLPNIMDSVVDHAIFNRFMSITTGYIPGNKKGNHPFHVQDLTDELDKILREIYKKVHNSGKDIEDILEHIPSLTDRSSRTTLLINNKYYTLQSEWLLWVSRVDTIYNIIKLLGPRGIRKNKYHINRLSSKIKEMENRDVFIEQKIPALVYYDYQEKIEYLKQLVGRR